VAKGSAARKSEKSEVRSTKYEGIISALAVNERLTFNDLKRLLQTTDGNLSVHARKLEEAQYVACDKTFEGRIPRTEYRLTAAGRRALEKYLVHMESIIKAVRD
jgi:DNA-binding HxlR family transcriptional regulator